MTSKSRIGPQARRRNGSDPRNAINEVPVWSLL